MKANKIFIALALFAVAGLTSCRDKFAELNQKPDAVTTAEPSFLATRAQTLFETNDYLFWFYNQSYYFRWPQLASSGVFSEGSYGMDASVVHRQTGYITMLTYKNAINNYIQAYEHPEYQAYADMCGVLAVYGAIYAIDINGDIQYTEASKYRDGGPLTPKYDRVEDLYDLFITELDQYIATFKDETQVVVSKQDIIYNGDLAKWAKLANTLKLKIAVRLYNNNPTKAGQIAQAVLSNGVGYIDTRPMPPPAETSPIRPATVFPWWVPARMSSITWWPASTPACASSTPRTASTPRSSRSSSQKASMTASLRSYRTTSSWTTKATSYPTSSVSLGTVIRDVPSFGKCLLNTRP